ncbi:hypothetical protein SH611_10440 [Geminicoccaceae bacterium 1502E]|nr:hypothetical protein [Geminicoccaceae bacterium 1502E]
MKTWIRLAGFLLVGYLCMKRSFAYLGVPPLFIGEIALGTFLLLKPRVALGTWAASLLRSSPLNALGLALLAFVLYGAWQAGRGVMAGIPLLYTLKFFVFNYYPLYLFLGLWIALHAPDRIPELIRTIAWCNGIYGLAYIVALRHVTALLPGTEQPLFSPPGGGAVAILGLLCFERDLRAVWIVLILNVVVTLAWQVRAEWLGLGLGMLVWGFLTGRLARVVAIGVAGLAALGLLELADVKLVGRTGSEVSFSETLARAVAPIDLDLARQLSPNAARHAGTAEWRELWWEQIWLSVHATPMREAFGHGYGFDLFGLAPEVVRAGQAEDIRTPHSVFYYALGYTGWVGVLMFAVLQAALLGPLLRSWKLGGQPAGLVWWVMGLSMAMFEESFETPFKAIPLYLLLGMAMAAGLRFTQRRDAARATARLAAAPRPAASAGSRVASG